MGALMNILTSLLVLLLGGMEAEASSLDDSRVISLCINDRVDEILSGRQWRERPAEFWVGHAEGWGDFVSDSQVAGEFRDEDAERFIKLLPSLRDREARRWNVPNGVTVRGFRVINGSPPSQDVLKRHLSFEFFAPGYSEDGKKVLVRGYYKPTAHGASITCLLERKGSDWEILGAWLKHYV